MNIVWPKGLLRFFVSILVGNAPPDFENAPARCGITNIESCRRVWKPAVLRRMIAA